MDTGHRPSDLGIEKAKAFVMLPVGGEPLLAEWVKLMTLAGYEVLTKAGHDEKGNVAHVEGWAT